MEVTKELKKMMDDMADNFESYLHLIDSFVIIDGITQEEYDEAVQTVKKLIKKLRKGKADDVFNKKRLREALASGKLEIE